MIARSTESKKSQKPAESAGQLEVLHFAGDVWRRWWKVVVPTGVLLAVVTGAIVVATFVPQYEAKTILWIDQEEPYLVSPEASKERNFVLNQLGLIRSSLVLAPIASQPEIATLPEVSGTSYPVEALKRLITVGQEFGSEHYHVKCTYPEAITAARIANAVTERFLLVAETNQSIRSNQLITLLEKERELSEQEVELVRENVRQMTIDQTGKDPLTLDSEPGGSSTAELENQLITSRIQQFVLEAQIEALEAADSPVSEEITEEMVDNHLRRQNQPTVRLDRRRQARKELEQLQLVGREKRLADLRDDLVASRINETVLQKAYEEALENAKVASGGTLELEVKRQQLSRANRVLDQIAERAFLLRTEQRAPARIELVEKATIPTQPIELGPQKRVMAASSFALVVPYLLAFLWEFRLQRIGNSEQLEKHADLAIIGEIASFPRQRVVPLGTEQSTHELRLFEESVDSFRSLLLLTDRLADTRTLFVTSAISGEGKTTVSTQLAYSIARATGEATLLIDGDIRSPQVHTVFGISNERGLTEVLDGEVSLADATDKSLHPSLHVLTAGRLQRNPHQQLRLDSMRALLADARDKYRYIVIDSSPVLAAGEALTIAKSSDAAIICAMRDHSRQALVQRARSRLVAAGANVIGGVVSGVSPRRYTYRYGHYKYGADFAEA